MDILLINPGKIRHDYITEHLGIASLKSFVNSRRFKAETLDMEIESLSVSEAIAFTLSCTPKTVGISLLDDSKNRGLRLISGLRNAGYKGYILVGGYFATFSALELLRDYPEIDFVVRGEGELTLTELLQRLIRQKGLSIAEIRGISYRDQIRIVQNPDRPLIADLDILPPVDRKYSKTVLNHGSALRVFGTRGCWGQCTFCDIVALYGQSSGKAWRSRSIVKLVDELEQLVKDFDTRYFVFNDDQFLLRGTKGRDRVIEFVAELKRRHLRIEFELMCRADTVQRDIMKELQSVGLKRIFIGLESFDPKQLERFKKRVSVRQNLKALITLYQLKIDVVASVILADAFTTFGDIVKQFMFLFTLKRRYFNSPKCEISINPKIEIYRGSAIYREYKQRGLLTTDHYLQGYEYKLKFWTGFRLRLFSWEAKLGRLLLRPGDLFKKYMTAIRWSVGQLKNYLVFQR
ncbi:MAG: B12-binding domain-containing radical SAM protein [bacterium]|nr:MAG: B12-binding domain-containing radical SAM protein [bacterium]